MSKRTAPKFSLHWFICGFILVVVLIIAVIINSQHINHTSYKFTHMLDIDNGDQAINWSKYPIQDIVLSDSLTKSELTITRSGVYHLTGSLSDGQVIVESGVSEVRLVLDNVIINNPDGPAIECRSAENLVIELVGGNLLSDGETYSSHNTDVTGTIYSKSDLILEGNGYLTINANYQDAIVGKDDIKFNGGNYRITAVDDAIRGKDSVYITAGNFMINSTTDAIKSTNETDFNKGFILITGGSFNLTTGGKGLEATHNIAIRGGNFVIEAYDDALHSDFNIGITSGTFNISSGDDGIHADHELIIDGGDIIIAKAYEGIESQSITINDGKLNLITSDDGINTGNTVNSTPSSKTNENCILTINGGDIYINASGDGVDSNGWIYFNGGHTIIDGPTNDGNGALDSDMGIIINGGTVIALGSSGMATSLGNNSTIYNASIYFTDTYPSHTKFKITDSAGNTIIEHTATKAFSHIAVGTSDFRFGGTYNIYLNDELYDNFIITNNTTTVGDAMYYNKPAQPPSLAP